MRKLIQLNLESTLIWYTVENWSHEMRYAIKNWFARIAYFWYLIILTMYGKFSPLKLVLLHNLFTEYIPVNLIRVKLKLCAWMVIDWSFKVFLIYNAFALSNYITSEIKRTIFVVVALFCLIKLWFWTILRENEKNFLK